jgi:Na+-driven multidrug efflux pump
MEKQAVYSMTEGNTAKLLLSFTIPMLIGNLFQQLYNMVDSIVVGRYVGANALAAVGATGSLNYMFFALSLGISVGIGVVVSQNFGANHMDMVEKGIINGIYLLIVGSILMSILGVVSARWVLVLLDTPEVILDDAVTYMRIVCGGILATAAYNGVSSI